MEVHLVRMKDIFHQKNFSVSLYFIAEHLFQTYFWNRVRFKSELCFTQILRKKPSGNGYFCPPRFLSEGELLSLLS